MCFDQFVEKESVCTDEQYVFAQQVQCSAGQVSSDLRSLFPHDFLMAADPVKRALALQGGKDLSILLGGFARWFQKRETSMEGIEDEYRWVGETLAPLCKSICLNMDDVSGYNLTKWHSFMIVFVGFSKAVSDVITPFLFTSERSSFSVKKWHLY